MRFCKNHPLYNFYAILTIVMMVGMVLMKTEFGAMRTHEINALNGDLYTTSARPYENATDDEAPNPRGKVIDLVVPIVVLICCVISMIYTGGFSAEQILLPHFHRVMPLQALQWEVLLVWCLPLFFYMIRRVVNFRDCMDASGRIQGYGTGDHDPDLAWTLKAMTDSLGAAVFVRRSHAFCCRWY